MVPATDFVPFLHPVMNKRKTPSFKVSSSWQAWLEHSLFPCLNACPVNLTAAAEAMWMPN